MAGTDLAVPDYAGEIEQSDDPAADVVLQCERARDLLAYLVEHGDLERIVEMKSQAEAIRVYTMSKQLGHEAQLSATEIVRRAERGLGLAIRKGQESGEIATSHEAKVYAGKTRQRKVDNSPLDRPRLASDIVGQDQLTGNGAGIYHMTDGVTDEQFEEAITEAKAERNLSRANVVRKVHKEDDPVTLSRAEARPRISTLAAQRRALTSAVPVLDGVCYGLDQITEVHPDITSEEAGQWVASLSEHRVIIERLIKRLKERTNAQA
jgi:hypothetical protein